MLNSEGRLKQALTVRKTLSSLEPFVPIYNVYSAFTMQINRDVSGTPILEELPAGGPVGGQRDNYLAMDYAMRGKYARAAQTLLSISPGLANYPSPTVEQAAEVIHGAPARIEVAGPTPLSESEINWVYAFVGAPERLLDHSENTAESGLRSQAQVNMVWHPSFAAARKTERFRIWSANGGLSITGADMAGPISATPSAPMISRAISNVAIGAKWRWDSSSANNCF